MNIPTLAAIQAQGLPFLLGQLAPETRAAVALLADIAADAEEIGPPLIADSVRRSLDPVGRAAGVPPLLLAALASCTGGLDSAYWREHLAGVAHQLAPYIDRAGVAGGVLEYLTATGEEVGRSASASRELAGRVMGALLILTAREMDPAGARSFAAVLRG